MMILKQPSGAKTPSAWSGQKEKKNPGELQSERWATKIGKNENANSVGYRW